MVDWETGKPNARYWVLKLLRDNFGPGDKLIDTHVSSPYVYASGALTQNGKRKLLLVNKRDRDIDMSIPDGANARLDFIDATTGSQPASSTKITSDRITLHGFSVAVVTWP
jgi:hypothetical protein